jgi:hypothetical protein
MLAASIFSVTTSVLSEGSVESYHAATGVIVVSTVLPLRAADFVPSTFQLVAFGWRNAPGTKPGDATIICCLDASEPVTQYQWGPAPRPRYARMTTQSCNGATRNGVGN